MSPSSPMIDDKCPGYGLFPASVTRVHVGGWPTHGTCSVCGREYKLTPANRMIWSHKRKPERGTRTT